MIPRLKELYYTKIQGNLQSKFSLKNKYMGARLIKVVINMGLGVDANDQKILNTCTNDLSQITGQKPAVTKFKKSIANFKTRKDSNAGLKVTLRNDKMYEFIDRLINIALPRIRDFKGLSQRGIDNSGNFTFGIKEQIVFPEVNFDKVDKIRGLDITIVTSSKEPSHTLSLLEGLNFPFVKEEKK